MGPEGGAGGGTVVATGTPEEVAAVPGSHTGSSCAETLGADQTAAARARRHRLRSRARRSPPDRSVVLLPSAMGGWWQHDILDPGKLPLLLCGCRSC